jgi:hypothetical protein
MENILTIDAALTKQRIIDDHRWPTQVARLLDVNYFTLNKILSGKYKHFPVPGSEYQRILHKLQEAGYLVQQTDKAAVAAAGLRA